MINSDNIADSIKKQSIFEYLLMTEPDKVKNEQEKVRQFINWPQEVTKTDIKRILSNEGTKFIRLTSLDNTAIAIQPLTGTWKKRADKVKDIRMMTEFFKDILSLNFPAFAEYQHVKKNNSENCNKCVYPYSTGVPIMAYRYIILCMEERWIVNKMCKIWFPNMEDLAREQIYDNEYSYCLNNSFARMNINGYDTVMSYLSESVYRYGLHFLYDCTIASSKYLPIPAIVGLGGMESPMINVVKVSDIEKYIEWSEKGCQAKIIKK